jgi:hypothetical protein
MLVLLSCKIQNCVVRIHFNEFLTNLNMGHVGFSILLLLTGYYKLLKQTYYAAYSFYITFIKYDIYLDYIKKNVMQEKKKLVKINRRKNPFFMFKLTRKTLLFRLQYLHQLPWKIENNLLSNS